MERLAIRASERALNTPFDMSYLQITRSLDVDRVARVAEPDNHNRTVVCSMYLTQ